MIKNSKFYIVEELAIGMKHTYFIEKYETPIPSSLDEWKIAFPPKVIEKLIKEYSKKGDVVFDPFAGFGTTLVVAKKLGRKAFGIEMEKEPVAFGKKYFDVEIINGNALDFNYSQLPKIDLCIFSPPYWGPALGAKNYSDYLYVLKRLALGIKKRMNRRASLIVIIQNYETKRGLLTQAWDVGNTLKSVFRLEQDIIWCVDRSKSKRDKKHEAADHHYCLVFRRD